MLFVLLCGFSAGIMIYNVATAFSAPSIEVVAKNATGNVAAYDDKNRPEWMPEHQTTKIVLVNKIHKAKSGDCLYNIAKQYNTTVKSIVALNKIVNANKISVGQEIIIGQEQKEVIVDQPENKLPEGMELKHDEVSIPKLNWEYLNPRNFFVPSNILYRKEEFPYYDVAEYIRQNKNGENNSNKNLASKNTFVNSKNLSFFEKADLLELKYNTPDQQHYTLAEIANSTLGKFHYRFGANMIIAKSGEFALADCSKYVNIIRILGGLTPLERSTAKMFAGANKFDKDSLTVGDVIGWKSHKNSNGKFIYGHAYIYIGEGQFANLSSRRKAVVITTLEKIQSLAKVYNMYMTA
jgi:LysM repeat protein